MSASKKINSTIYTSLFTSWQESVPRLLDATNLPDRLAAEKRIIIKPNLVEPLKPPITTPVELIAALVDFIHASLPHLEIIIGEGCGSSSKNSEPMRNAVLPGGWVSHRFHRAGVGALGFRCRLEGRLSMP